MLLEILLAHAIDAIFQPLTPPGAPGCAVAVFQNDAIAFERGYGLADIERHVPITPETVFNVGSISKQFTAYLTWQLIDEKRIALADDVRRYIPELPDYGTPIRVRDLIYQTSGLRDYTNLNELAGVLPEEVTTHAGTVALIVRQRGLDFTPGTKHEYSNSNYVLLAEIAQRVTKTSFRELTDTRFFAPLKMTRTHFVADHNALIPDRALAYNRGESGYRWAISNAERLGAGGLHSTVRDLLAWDRLAYEPSFAPMLETGRVAGKSIEYASGLYLGTYRGLPIVRHGGSTSGYRAELLRFPTRHTSIAVLCNTPTNPRPVQLAEKVADVVLGDALAKPDVTPVAEAPTVSPEQFASTLGDYWNPDTGQVRRLSMRDGKPLYVIDPFSRARLTPVSATAFRFGANTITVTRTARGDRELRLRWSDGREESYVELRRVAVTPAQLARYAGRYESEELDTRYRIEVRGSALALIRRNQDDRILEPTARDRFSDGQVRIRFLRDSRGRISGFLFGEDDLDRIAFSVIPLTTAAAVPR